MNKFKQVRGFVVCSVSMAGLESELTLAFYKDIVLSGQANVFDQNYREYLLNI